MRKFWIVMGLALATAPALAEETLESPDDWHDAHYACRMGETREGVALQPSVVDANCAASENLGEILLAHGYCWSVAEQEWFVSGEVEGFCGPVRE